MAQATISNVKKRVVDDHREHLCDIVSAATNDTITAVQVGLHVIEGVSLVNGGAAGVTYAYVTSSSGAANQTVVLSAIATASTANPTRVLVLGW